MRFLEPDPFVLRPTTASPTHDRAPDELATGSPMWLRDELHALLSPNKVLSRTTDLVRYATDASPYRLFPKVVVLAQTVEDVRAVFRYAQGRNLPVTLRAAGTSLSGQAQGDGILLEVKRHWVGVTVEAGGRRLRAKPGTILGHANLALHPHGYRLGPDPANASACTLGGVIANNSSGMCCGTVQNSYQTLESPTTLQEAMVAVAARAGLPLWLPKDVAGTCCATVWQSKGYHTGNVLMANRLIENLWRWSDSGHLPIVVDASSCTYGILHDVLTQLTPQNAERHRTLAIYDSVAWAYNHLLPRLQVQRKVQRAVIHPTCSTEHLGLNKTLLALAAALADEAVTPTAATCCGFAGDRGFLHPELTQAATFEEANEVRQQVYDAYLSSNRTLELAVEMGVAHRLKARLLMQPWLILAGCWTLPNRSLVKTAKVVRAWVERIARALACRERLTQTLRATVAAMHRVGRQAYRRKQPATWQLLGGTFAGLA